MLDIVLTTVFYQVPEGIMIALGGLGLVGITKPRMKLVALGSAYGLLIPVARGLGMPYGFHTAILLLMFVALASVWLKLRALTAFAAWVFANFFISIGEQLVALPLLTALGIAPEVVLSPSHPGLYILWGWISKVPMLIVVGLVILRGLTLIPARDESVEAS